MFRLLVRSSLFVCCVLEVFDCCAQTPVCDATSGELVAQIYAFAAPVVGDDDRLKTLLAQDAKLYADGGTANACLKGLAQSFDVRGRELTSAASGQAPADYGAHLVKGPGNPAQRADAARTRSARDFLGLAREMNWLAAVLPALANGDAAAYTKQNTPLREMLNTQIMVLKKCLVANCQDMEAGFVAELKASTEKTRQLIIATAKGTVPHCQTESNRCLMAEVLAPGDACYCLLPDATFKSGTVAP